MSTLTHKGLLGMKLATRVKGFGRLNRCVLAAICSHANSHGIAYPTLELIAQEADTNESRASKTVKTLEGLGVLSVGRPGWHRPHVYHVNIRVLESVPMIESKSCPADNPEGERVAEPETQGCQNAGSGLSPGQVKGVEGELQGEMKEVTTQTASSVRRAGAGAEADICRCCGKPGHWAVTCPDNPKNKQQLERKMRAL